MIRWFGHWLRDEDNGVDTEAPVRLFVRHATRPEPDLAEHAGRWRAEPGWPADGVATRTLTVERPGDERLDVRPDTGSSAWISCAGRLPWGQPQDQRADDAWSLTYDWPVDEPMEVVGHPNLAVRLRSSAPVAFISAKLEDVFPDGTSALVTRGLLNLSHRASSTDPEPMPVDVPVDITLKLEATAYAFVPGHRIRLALAGTDWPNTWPPPTPVTLTIERASLRFALPVLTGPSPLPEPHFQPPPNAGTRTDEDEPSPVWRLEHDVLARRTTAVVDHGATYRGARGVTVTDAYQGQVTVPLRDPGRATASARCRFELAWPDVTCAVEADLHIDGHPDRFDVAIDLSATEDGAPFASRSWRKSIPRDLL
jgi:predicted acyl esterase